MIDELCDRFAIVGRVRDAAISAYQRVASLAYPAQVRAHDKILHAFEAEGLAESDFAASTGYGYDDPARERYEGLLARVLGAERAMARLSIVSGTHAIVAALAAVTPPGGAIVSVTGAPYDTLRNALRDAPDSIRSQGVAYEEIALRQDGSVDLAAVERAFTAMPRATAFVQRSRGYAPRPSLDIAQCEAIGKTIARVAPQAAVLVDNCYGELVEEREPCDVGADLVMGSLIKNLGGSVAPTGGYVAGRADLVERVAARVYAPGLGAALGPTLGYGRAFIQGLWLAPLVVGECLRGLDFLAALFETLGFEVEPQPGATRTDIIQAIALGTPELLERFSAGLQSAMPVNARFKPMPGPVPGYRDRVLMSSGAFVSGATIELSCDAPLRAPYYVYVQGGVTRRHAYLGALRAAVAVQASA
jgi:cystathionine beta-lyase family protein involved in aluminum resistance